MLGMGIIMRAWCTVIAGGKPPSIPCPAEYRDILADLGPPYPRSKTGLKELQSKKRGTLQVWSLLDKLRYYTPPVLDIILHSKEYLHLIFIPNKLIAKLRTQAMDSMNTFISENDIVTAIVAKVSSVVIKIHGRVLIP